MWDNILAILFLAGLASLIFTKVFVAQFLLALTITVMVPVLSLFFIFDLVFYTVELIKEKFENTKT